MRFKSEFDVKEIQKRIKQIRIKEYGKGSSAVDLVILGVDLALSWVLGLTPETPETVLEGMIKKIKDNKEGVKWISN